MDETTCAQTIAAALRDLGVQAGDSLLMHASFKSLGPVPGGIETLIRGLLAALGPEGTLALPALSWALRPPQVYDPRLTPSNVGAVPEYFRQRPGTRRSLHPTHSVCAVGRRTDELLGDHALDSTPCGAHSPFHKLAENGGKILMLGCGLGPNTTMHALEEYVEPPYLYGATFRFTLTDWDGHTYEKDYRTHGFHTHGYGQRYDRVFDLPHAAFLRRGMVLAADSFLLDTPKLKTAVLAKLREAPLFFVERLAGARP